MIYFRRPYARHPLQITLLLLLPFALPACGQKSFEEMANEMAGNKNSLVYCSEIYDSLQGIVILDARERSEYDVSHIGGAQCVGYDKFNVADIADLPKDAHIVVYCSVGYRSGLIAKKMKDHGYTDVSNLWGGIFNWVNKGLPVVNEAGATDEIHPYSEEWGKWLTAGTKSYGR